MVNVYKNEYYTTIGTDRGVYLVSGGRVLAFKPSPKSSNHYSMFIDKQIFISFTMCSNELVNELVDYISEFCEHTPSDIVNRVNRGEFAIKDLQNLF